MSLSLYQLCRSCQENVNLTIAFALLARADGELVQCIRINSLVQFSVLAKIQCKVWLMQTINMEMAAEKLVMRIRLQAFNNVLSQPMAWYDFNKNTVGSLLTRMDRDAPLIKGVRFLFWDSLPLGPS